MFIPRAPLIKMQSAPGALRVLHVENLSPGLARRASVLNHEARVNANSFVKRCILTNNMRELPEWARACVLGACACVFLFFSYERRQSCTKTQSFLSPTHSFDMTAAWQILNAAAHFLIRLFFSPPVLSEKNWRRTTQLDSPFYSPRDACKSRRAFASPHHTHTGTLWSDC